MKFRVYFSILISVLIFSACSSSQNNDVHETVSIEKLIVEEIVVPTSQSSSDNIERLVESHDSEEEWTYYSNGRFGFTIRYPSSWVTGEESQNGDGKILYIGNPDVDIRVYGGHYMEGISDIYHNEKLARQYTKLENGNEAVLLLGKENGKVIYDMVYVSSEQIEYHFYAEVSEDFFEKNEKILLEVAISLDTPE